MISIYRAKKIDSDEYVEGYILPKDKNNEFVIIEHLWWENRKHFHIKYEIDLSTLAISFDGGEHFYSLSFVERAIDDHRESIREINEDTR